MSIFSEVGKEIDLAPGFSVEQAVSCLRKYGGVVLREAIDPGKARAFAEKAAAEFERLDQMRERMSDEDKQILDRMEMPVPERDASLRTQVENYELLDSPRLVEIIETLGGPFVWHYPPSIRRQTPGQTKGYLPYHQDAPYMRHGSRFYVCWTPFSPCGEEAPGLELAIGRIEELLKHEAAGAWQAQLAPEYLEEIVAKLPKYAPVFAPGDVALFEDRFLHRTHVGPGMSKVRYSIDFRAHLLNTLSDKSKTERKFVNPRTFKLTTL